MTEKKEIKEKKIVKPVAAKKKKEEPKIVEQHFFAKDLADKMGIASFDFLLIKREAGIEDGSQITRSEMQKLYNKIIKR